MGDRMELWMFVIGSILGSFICAYSFRFINHESIVKGRSYCENCKRQLLWYELIPIISYMMLKGRCKTCHHKIRPMHLICEITGGMIGILSYVRYGIGIELIIIMYICFVMMFIAIVDYYTMDVYVLSLVILFVGELIYLYVLDIDMMFMIGILCLSVPLTVMNLIFGECMGWGDIQFISLVSMILGKNVLVMVLIASFIACSHILIYKRKSMTRIPFVPYLVLGVYLIILV